MLGKPRGLARDGADTGTKQSKVYLLSFSKQLCLTGKSQLDPGLPVLGQKGKRGFQGLCRKDWWGEADEALGRLAAKLPCGPRQTRQGYGLGRSVAGTEMESSIDAWLWDLGIMVLG